MPESVAKLRSILNTARASLFKNFFRARFRYDVFISYNHRAKGYAVNLKKQLADLDFTCFIDQEESPPGLSLDPTLQRALSKSAVLVLLATERALTRPYITLEFEKFVSTGRRIIPINISGALTNNDEQALATAPWNIIKQRKLIWIDEVDDAFAKEVPSPPIADGIDKLFKYTRRNARVRTEIIGTALLVLLAAIGAGFVIKGQAAEVSKQARLANDAKRETETQLGIAKAAGEEAERQLGLAAEATKEAKRQGEIARTAKKEAEHQQEIARTATEEADKQQRLASEATAEAQRQQAIAAAQTERNRHFLYDSDINLSQRAHQGGHLARVRQLLQPALSNPANEKQNDLRGFEWFYYWRLASHRPVSLGQVDYVGHMEISPDGKLLATVTEGMGQLKLWNLATQEEFAKLDAHKDRATSLAFSADSRILATASADTTVKLWNVSNGKVSLIRTLSNGRAGVGSVAFSRDGTMLATRGFDKTIKLWETNTGTLLTTIQGSSEPASLSFSPDGNTLVTYEDTSLRLLGTRPPYAKDERVLTNEEIGCISFTTDGKQLIAGVSGNKLRVMGWPDYTSVSFLEVPGSHACPFTTSRDGHTLATLSNNAAHVWGAAFGRFEVDGWFTSLALTPNGKTLAIMSSGEVSLWEVRGVQELTSLQMGEAVDQVAFFSSAKILVTLANKKVGLWNSDTLEGLPALEDDPWGVEAFALSRDDRLATGHEDGGVTLWNVATRKALGTRKVCADAVRALSFSADGRTLAAGCNTGKVELWDTQTGKSMATLRGHSGPIRSLAFSAAGTIATGSEDKTVRVWNPATGHQIWLGANHRDEVYCLAFSFDGKTLASGSKDETVKLWQASTGKEQATLTGNRSPVASVAFSPDGKTLVTGGGLVKLWDPQTAQELVSFDRNTAPVVSLAFSPDGKTLAAGSWDRTVKLWFAARDDEVKVSTKD
jgi:WD40 repeat protein